MSLEGRVGSGRGRWLSLSLLPFGLGSWVPIVAGVRCGVRRWVVLGVFWSVLAVAGWALSTSSTTFEEVLCAVFLVVSWVGGAITSL